MPMCVGLVTDLVGYMHSLHNGLKQKGLVAKMVQNLNFHLMGLSIRRDEDADDDRKKVCSCDGTSGTMGAAGANDGTKRSFVAEAGASADAAAETKSIV